VTADEQVARWVNGKSEHRDIPGDKHGECCPDFSCCDPSLKAAPDIRARFALARERGDETTTNKLLASFLGALVRKHPRAGRTPKIRKPS
jgi:hypothetical protein